MHHASSSLRGRTVVLAGPVAGDIYKLKDLADGFCLDTSGLGLGEEAADDQCVQGSDAQKWKLQSTTNAGYYKLVNQASYGGCLEEINSQSGDDHAFDDTCAAGDGAEEWALQSTTTSGYYKLVNFAYGYCAQADGVIDTVACGQGATAQKWEFQAAS